MCVLCVAEVKYVYVCFFPYSFYIFPFSPSSLVAVNFIVCFVGNCETLNASKQTSNFLFVSSPFLLSLPHSLRYGVSKWHAGGIASAEALLKCVSMVPANVLSMFYL